jgi:hypothetical protein
MTDYFVLAIVSACISTLMAVISGYGAWISRRTYNLSKTNSIINMKNSIYRVFSECIELQDDIFRDVENIIYKFINIQSISDEESFKDTNAQSKKEEEFLYFVKSQANNVRKRLLECIDALKQTEDLNTLWHINHEIMMILQESKAVKKDVDEYNRTFDEKIGLIKGKCSNFS